MLNCRLPRKRKEKKKGLLKIRKPKKGENKGRGKVSIEVEEMKQVVENVIDIMSEVMIRRDPMDLLEGVAWMVAEDQIGIVINTGMGGTGTGKGSVGMEK